MSWETGLLFWLSPKVLGAAAPHLAFVWFITAVISSRVVKTLLSETWGIHLPHNRRHYRIQLQTLLSVWGNPKQDSQAQYFYPPQPPQGTREFRTRSESSNLRSTGGKALTLPRIKVKTGREGKGTLDPRTVSPGRPGEQDDQKQQFTTSISSSSDTLGAPWKSISSQISRGYFQDMTRVNMRILRKIQSKSLGKQKPNTSLKRGNEVQRRPQGTLNTRVWGGWFEKANAGVTRWAHIMEWVEFLWERNGN